MAQELATDNTGLIVAIGGWLVAIVIAMLTFVAQWRKGGADETAVVLTKWKELVETHERQITVLKDEISSLRGRVEELETLAHDQRLIIERLERELAGERRNSAQQARSFKAQLKRLGHNDERGVLDDETPSK